MDEKHCEFPPIIDESMRTVKLSDVEHIKPFDCGDEDLNGFLPLLIAPPEDQPTVPLYYDLLKEIN